MQNIILGAGVTGLTAAHELHRQGFNFVLYEQADAPGGLCRTVCRDGFTYDTVSHVLHFHTPEVRDLVLGLLNHDVLEVRRKAMVYFEGRHVPYPFQMSLGRLPAADAVASLASFIAARLRSSFHPRPVTNLSDWVDCHFGRGVKKRFMQPYNEKLWRTPLEQLSIDWMPFVPNVSLWDILRGMISSDNCAGYNSRFVVPRQGGIDRVVTALASHLPNVNLRKRAVAVSVAEQVVRFHDNSEAEYDSLISSIPLPDLTAMTTDAPAEIRRLGTGLHASGVVVLTYCLGRRLPHDYHWIYFPQPDFPFFRLFFSSNVNPAQAPPGSGIVSAEIAVGEQYNAEEIEQKTLASLQQLGYLDSGREIVAGSAHYFRYGYPCHDLGRSACVRRIREFYRAHGVHTAGRFGAWAYSCLDDDIAAGIAASAACTIGNSLPVCQL